MDWHFYLMVAYGAIVFGIGCFYLGTRCGKKPGGIPKMENPPPQPPATCDWPEDFNQDNLNYQNLCNNCNTPFKGNKHRIICKLCSRGN